MKSEQLRVAYLGPQGTYTHQAAVAKFKDSPAEFVPCDTIALTFESVCQNQVDFACIPLENSLHGSVIETFDLLRDGRIVTIGGESVMGIEHCLVVCRGITMGDIKRALSHEQALGQCRGFLSMNLPNVVQVRTSSTASAAEQLLELLKAGDPSARHSAAVCSRVCADLHEELEVLQSGIQDGEINFTRYIVLSKAPLLLHPRSATLQRALLRCVLPLGRDAPVSLTSVFRLFPEDIQVMRVDRRPALSGTPFHDCVFLEVECSPLISCNTDIGQLWRDKLAAAVEAINAGIGLPCCHILGAW
ncbi:Prephenate dehydratase [Ceratobasidium theobromae]|uniref:prephenate dehydratase n=1 Tax=Ceratobasidium theobromae TaxID=1582974 RepID=A0A5N5QQL3_9AGAM|nr:Prephenate dehydratase [Ceratobasidium theobromae]